MGLELFCLERLFLQASPTRSWLKDTSLGSEEEDLVLNSKGDIFASDSITPGIHKLNGPQLMRRASLPGTISCAIRLC